MISERSVAPGDSNNNNNNNESVPSVPDDSSASSNSILRKIFACSQSSPMHVEPVSGIS